MVQDLIGFRRTEICNDSLKRSILYLGGGVQTGWPLHPVSLFINFCHMNRPILDFLRPALLVCFALYLHDSADLQAQEWVQLNDPPFLKHHSNGYGYEGKAYIFEGVFQNDGPDRVSNELWEYTPETDSWVRLLDFPGVPRSIAIGDDWDGKYYYGFGFGGNQVGYLNDLWVFDPVDTSFTQLPSCPCVGRTHPAFVAHQDKIYMGSGSSANGDLTDWWVYDMKEMMWTQKEDIPGPRRHHPFQFSADRFIYVGGGHQFNWMRWDPQTDQWDSIDDYPQGRVAGTQFSYDGKGFVLGGDDFRHDHVPDEDTFLRYDPDEDIWEKMPQLPNGSRWAPSSFIIEDDLYYFGGLSDIDISDSTMWKIDLSLLDVMVSTDELGNGEGISFWPNPATEFITVNAVSDQVHSVQIIDMQGRLVKDAILVSSSQTLRLHSTIPGIYWLRFMDVNGSEIFKSVLQIQGQ